MAVLAFDGVRSFQLSVPGEIFGEEHGAGARTKLQLCALDDNPIHSSTGYRIETPYRLKDVASADVVFIPSWTLPYEPPSKELIEALRSAEARGSILVGLCLGAFVLAETGLLDGKRATTHWAFAREFHQRFPKVELEEAALYVDQDNLLTSAGVAAGIDCCLHLANRLFGARPANRIARNIVAAPHRTGGQLQFIDRPIPARNRDSRLRDTMYEIVRTIGDKHTINTVAAEMGMSRRNFTRLFKQNMGVAFREWLADMRLAIAARALEASERSVEQIAQETGFGSAVTFRAQFAKRYGVSPAAWRRSFFPTGPVARA